MLLIIRDISGYSTRRANYHTNHDFRATKLHIHLILTHKTLNNQHTD